MTVWLIYEDTIFQVWNTITNVVKVCKTEKIADEWIDEALKEDCTRYLDVKEWNVTERLF